MTRAFASILIALAMFFAVPLTPTLGADAVGHTESKPDKATDAPDKDSTKDADRKQVEKPEKDTVERSSDESSSDEGTLFDHRLPNIGPHGPGCGRRC